MYGDEQYDDGEDSGYGTILSQLINVSGQLGTAALLSSQQSTLATRGAPGSIPGTPIYSQKTNWLSIGAFAIAAIAAVFLYKKL